MWCLQLASASAKHASASASLTSSLVHSGTRCFSKISGGPKSATGVIKSSRSVPLSGLLANWTGARHLALPLPPAYRQLISRGYNHSHALIPNGLALLQWQRHAPHLANWNMLTKIWPNVSSAWIMDGQSLLAPLLALYRHLPGTFRLAHLHIISALNLAGNNLLRTFAIFMAEVTRSSAFSKADSFSFYVEPDTSHVLADFSTPWWQTLPVEIIRSLLNMTRLLWLAIIFTPVIFSSPLALSYDLYRDEWMELLRNTLQTAGPAFIKWGQWAATRLDLFPPDMCAELEKLQTEAPTHSFRETKVAIESAFGLPLADMFEEIGSEAVASGSIGQIHRAVLSRKGAATTGCYPGQVVAVKVRHPGVAETISQDFEAMLWVAHIFGNLPALAHLRLEDTLKQFAAPLKEQVDLAREANNLQRFNYNFRNAESVRFPVPLYPLVSTDVLVETFEEGDHITAYIQSQHNLHNHRLSLLGSGTMLQMMLVDNLIHSDLHPGNILVRLEPPTGLQGLIYKGLDRLKRREKISNMNRARIDNLQQSWLQPQIVLLDVGMATELTSEDQRNMVGLFKGLAMLDGRECGHWTLRFSGRQQSCPDPEAFKEDMERAFAAVRLAAENDPTPSTPSPAPPAATTASPPASSPSSSGQQTANAGSKGGQGNTQYGGNADALGYVLELVRQHQVVLPGHICAAVVTTMVLEGWSSKLDPDHSVLSQVNKMFEATNLRWAERITRLVDEVMETEDSHLVLT